MKGLVKYALGMDGVGLQDLPDPVLKEGECKVKVLAASICGSDIHAMRLFRHEKLYPVLCAVSDILCRLTLKLLNSCPELHILFVILHQI